MKLDRALGLKLGALGMPKFMTRAAFCPSSSRLPNGRARKLTAKVTKVSSVASTGSDLATSAKKMSPK